MDIAIESLVGTPSPSPTTQPQAPIIVPKLVTKSALLISKPSHSSSSSQRSSPGDVEPAYIRKKMDARVHGLQTPKKGDWRLKPDKEFTVIDCFVLGDREIEPHFQPQYLPKVLSSRKIEKLYICQWCFRYTTDLNVHSTHSVSHYDHWIQICQLTNGQIICSRRNPKNLPGHTVYEKYDLSVRRIDGNTSNVDEKLFLHDWLQLASCFIQTKALIMWTSNFDFHLLYRIPTFDGVGPWQGRKNVAWTEYGIPQCVGYNSREKHSLAHFNLSCIVILPPWLKLGLFNLLTGLSYEASTAASRQEGPEAPISDAGKVAYERFWDVRIARRVLKAKSLEEYTVASLATSLGMKKDELLNSLKRMDCIEGPTIRQRMDTGWAMSPEPPAQGRKVSHGSHKPKPQTAIINKAKLVRYLTTVYPPSDESKKRKLEAVDKQRQMTRIKLENPIDIRSVVVRRG